jgi:hypothetical protein
LGVLRFAFCVLRFALSVGRWALGVLRFALSVERWALGVEQKKWCFIEILFILLYDLCYTR